MKTFLVKDKKPVLKWGRIADNTFFKGKVPEGYKLAVSPHFPYIILDVDVKPELNGFLSIPSHILEELKNTLNHATKSGGRHYFLKYTGTKKLLNKHNRAGIDLRTHKGYAVWYRKGEDIQACMDKIKETSVEMNAFLEKFYTNET